MQPQTPQTQGICRSFKLIFFLLGKKLQQRLTYFKGNFKNKIKFKLRTGLLTKDATSATT